MTESNDFVQPGDAYAIEKWHFIEVIEQIIDVFLAKMTQNMWLNMIERFVGPTSEIVGPLKNYGFAQYVTFLHNRVMVLWIQCSIIELSRFYGNPLFTVFCQFFLPI